MDVPPQDYSVCRACKADIVFGRTGKKRGNSPVLMPVDVKPDPKGNVVLAVQDGRYYAGVVGRNKVRAMRAAGVDLHFAHFVTCTQAARFRQFYPDGKP